MKTAFRLSSAKRKKYIQFLASAGVEDPPAPPAPVLMRCYSWLEAIVHHRKYFKYYKDMMHAIDEEFGDAAGINDVINMLDDDRFKELDITMRCVAVFGEHIIHTIKVAEDQKVSACKAVNQMSQSRGHL